MEDKRKGICKNFGNCINADNKLLVELDLTADFICPECQQDLVEIEHKSAHWKKILIPLISLLVIGGASLGIYSYINSPKNKVTNVLKTVKELNKDAKFDNNTVSHEGSTSKNPPAIPVDKIDYKKSNVTTLVSDALNATTLEDGLHKIGDTQYSQKSRKALLAKMLTKFENSSVKVKVLVNNNEYNYFTIDEYLNRILIQGIKNISVKNEVKNNSGLINELDVNE